jgi:hypothetical protein
LLALNSIAVPALGIAKDGTKTEIISQAAKFYSFADAQEFGKQMNIKLTELTYIGQDDFIDSDQ